MKTLITIANGAWVGSTTAARIPSAVVRPCRGRTPSIANRPQLKGTDLSAVSSIQPVAMLKGTGLFGATTPVSTSGATGWYLLTDRTSFLGGMEADPTMIADQADHRGNDATNGKFSTRVGPRSCSPPV